MTGQRAIERKLADTHSLLVAAQGHRREELVQLRQASERIVNLEALAAELEAENTTLRQRVVSRNLVLARAHAHHMFGDRAHYISGVLDRVGALHYLRDHGLPEATADDLDAACEGLVTPWGSRPGPECEECESAAAWRDDPNNGTGFGSCSKHGQALRGPGQG